ncbi:MAG TPA: hypothetical protein VKB54_01465 [Solirubrobacteraceae bacterium]|jgi:Flp pilus assembly pilin Flp|nr:hypothetical protein [Solirubrobacteraceae bacterium]
MDFSSDSGQSTVEWLALMAMLIALAGVLVTVIPGVGDSIANAFEKIVNAVSP